MYQTMKTFLLLVAVIQLAHPTFAQEDEQDSELLAAETARRKAFFEEHNLELSQQNTNLTQATHVTRDENLALKFKLQEMDKNITQKSNEVFELLQTNVEISNQNINLTKLTSALRDELVSKSMELGKKEIQIQNMNDRFAQLEEINLKITDRNRNLMNSTSECKEKLNNSNLILSNQNTAKNAEDLQKIVTSMNFSLSNVMDEIAKLKERSVC
ncbi:hypothetical protein B566_EDAN016067 [Ephemera danica]|nr:hypothetical protein B566_EDAN016067 [Ephemera danica]